MRRVTQDELVFYDRVASRINMLLGSRECALTQSSLSKQIGWNRASLCNFINRIDKSVAAHFIPRIASALNVSTEHLMSGEATPIAQRTRWDPRSDDVDFMLEKMRELNRRNAHRVCLIGYLPAEALPNHAMIANFVDSMANGASTTAAERWHELIDAKQRSMKENGAQDVDYIIPLTDLLRLPKHQPPYQSFTDDEVVYLLDNLKKEWIRQRDWRIIAIQDPLLTPEVELQLAGNLSLSVYGSETQVRCHRDLRIDWDDNPDGVRLSRECLVRLKRSAGYGVRERPTVRKAEELIDQILLQVEPSPRTVRKGVLPETGSSSIPSLSLRGSLHRERAFRRRSDALTTCP